MLRPPLSTQNRLFYLSLLGGGLGLDTSRLAGRGGLDGSLRPLDGTGTSNSLLFRLLGSAIG